MEKDKNTIENKDFKHSYRVDKKIITPSYGFFQKSYPLSKDEYNDLKSGKGLLHSIGVVFIVFGVSYGIPHYVNHFFHNDIAVRLSDLIISLVSISFGGLLMLLGYFIYPQRRLVLKNIKLHFEQNPGQPEIRIEEDEPRD